MEACAYMVVTPPPKDKVVLQDEYGNKCFWVKFGDGTFRNAYKTHNPMFAPAECPNASAEKTKVAYHDGKVVHRFSGKALEIALTNRMPGHQTEWHKLTPKLPYSYANVRDALATLLENFPEINLKPEVKLDRVTSEWEDTAAKLFNEQAKVD